ncbi:hypothetical protein [Ramlibacter sp.]|uniref:hypothetical protein n=1 Tax=Ramlibacter sp. TaxID=1917967 RepID=UPI0035B24DE5
MLNIRYEPTETSEPCPCGCGGRTISLTRFVEADGEPVAVCYARLATSHPDRIAAATLSLGDFAEGSTPADRVAFAWSVRLRDDLYHLDLLEAAQSPWQAVEVIGRTLGRQEAAQHPRVEDAWQLAEHVLGNDLVLRRYLAGEPEGVRLP